MVETESLRLDGIVTYWSTAAFTELQPLTAHLIAAGFANFIPEARTGPAALRDALEEVFPTRNFKVEPLSTKSAFEIVQVERGLTRNTWYHQYRVAIDDQKQVEVSPYDWDVADKIVAAFNRHLGLVTPAAVSKSILSILESYRGTRLRPQGSIYWLPETYLERWRELAAELEKVPCYKGQNRIYVIRHPMDADSMRAVRDGIVAEITSEAKRLHDEVTSGKLGERALLHREEDILALREKIAIYEDLLSTGLSELGIHLQTAEDATMAAKMLLAAGSPTVDSVELASV